MSNKTLHTMLSALGCNIVKSGMGHTTTGNRVKMRGAILLVREAMRYVGLSEDLVKRVIDKCQLMIY